MNFKFIDILCNLLITIINYRIFKKMSQEDLANKLNVASSQVSRDERNEYYGATKEKLQKVMEALGVTFKTEILKEEELELQV